MKSVLFATAALLAAGPAAAADFGGPRVELHGGWDRFGLSETIDGEKLHGHKTGVDLGLGAGYDLQEGHFVIGVEGAADYASTKACGDLDDGGSACLKANRDFEAGVRAGVVAGKALVYGKVAYANGRLTVRYEDGEDSFSGHTNRGGIRYGAGIQLAASERSYVKLEYRYTDYKSARESDGVDSIRLDGNRNQVLIGFGLRF